MFSKKLRRRVLFVTMILIDIEFGSDRNGMPKTAVVLFCFRCSNPQMIQTKFKYSAFVLINFKKYL